MHSAENLYYALGEMLYAIAAADGKIQREEKEMLKNLVAGELGSHAGEYTSIIFQILERDRLSLSTAAEWSERELKMNSHYLSPAMKTSFKSAIRKVAASFPPVTEKEQKLVDDFSRMIDALEGDPVYYKQ